jgi:7-carboxy-7-deazaguanine synthase
MSLLVTELFHSIQGESTWTGLPCGFVRLSGCNLRCRYCDTQYAYAPGDLMQIDDILNRLERFDCTHVTVTGGEPLLQEETPILISRLLQKGYHVSLETNGSLDIGSVDPLCTKVMDLKCPSSGMQSHNRMANLRLLGPLDQVKFVIADHEDYQFALMMAGRLTSHIQHDRILFSPVHGHLTAPDLARWMLRDSARGRLQIQLHRYLWPDEIQGV